jgi:hydrogenase nickel incorporation protein HypB
MTGELSDTRAQGTPVMQNRRTLKETRMLSVAVVGPPGAGKTALIEATARQLRGQARVVVVVINPAAARDADRISRYCDQVEAVNTAVPGNDSLQPALEQIDLANTDILFIETIGGISGAPDLGQDVTITVLSVSGGDDKAAEYARLLAESAALILCKAELQRHVMFDRAAFHADVRRINPLAELMEISAFENTGLTRWLNWLDLRRQEKDPGYSPPKTPPPPAEWYFG